MKISIAEEFAADKLLALTMGDWPQIFRRHAQT
jgi:hypothetical protein